MRSLSILFLLVSLSVSVFGQNTLTPDLATEFVHKKINELNLTIWEAVNSGKIKAYSSDSLATQITPEELEEQTNLITTVMVTNPLNLSDPYDLVPRYDTFRFNPHGHFSGVDLHYKKVLKGKKISFELVSIAPLWIPFTESGINLGLIPLYHIKTKDLKRLSGVDYPFYDALFATRASLGDFVNPYYAPYDDALKLGQGITYYNTWHSQHYINFSAFQDSVVGHHLAFLPVAIAIERHRGNSTLYKDKKLTQPFLNIETVLQDSATVMVPNPDNPDDPYDLIGMNVYELFELSNIKYVSVLRSSNDMIINLKKRCLVSGGYISTNQCSRDIYYSFSKSKKFIRKYDRIVLETLLEEISK